MKRRLAICLLAGVLGCTTGRVVPAPEPRTVADEASFVEAFLRLRFAVTFSKEVPLVIAQRLSIDMLLVNRTEADLAADLVREAEQQHPRLVEAVRDFCSKNTGTNTVDALGPLGFRHVVLTEEQQNRLFKTSGQDGWTAFYRTYPNSPGIITLSRPGFSRDGRLAVIYMGNQSHWLAGHGRIFVLQRTDGKWTMAAMWLGPAWVS